jgi:hypothetical protein
MRLLTHQAGEAAGLDFLHQPDVLVAVSLCRRWEPVTETDTRPVFMGEQDADMGVVARARGLHLEVVAHPSDVRLSYRGRGGQWIPSAPSGPKPLQILVFIHVEKSPVIADLLDPGQLRLVENNRAAGRTHPPADKRFLQAALLLAEVARPSLAFAQIVHSRSLSHNLETWRLADDRRLGQSVRLPDG